MTMTRHTPLISGPACALLTALLLLAAAGCSSGSGCGEHERPYNGRCICDFGYTDLGGVCVPVSQDGDLEPSEETDDDTVTEETDDLDDADTSDDGTDQDESLPVTTGGTCADPEALYLNSPMIGDFAGQTDLLRQDWACRLVAETVAWDGPEHIFAFSFAADVLSGGKNFLVTVTPEDGGAMAYSVSVIYSERHLLLEECGFKQPIVNCRNQAVAENPTTGAVQVEFGLSMATPRAGDTAYIVVDTKVGNGGVTPGRYRIEVSRHGMTCANLGAQRCDGDDIVQCAQTGDDWTLVESCVSPAVCQEQAALTAACVNEPTDGDVEEDVEEQEQEIQPGILQVKDYLDIIAAEDSQPIMDLVYRPVTEGASPGTRFGFFQVINNGTLYSWNMNFLGDFSLLQSQANPDAIYGGLACTIQGDATSAINFDRSSNNYTRKFVGGLASGTLDYPDDMSYVQGMVYDKVGTLWVTDELSLWKINPTTGQGVQYTYASYPKLRGVATLTVDSDTSLLVLANNEDDSQSTLLVVTILTPGDILTTIPLAIPVMSIVYASGVDERLYAGPKNPGVHMNLVRFKCLPLNTGSQCSDEE